MITRDGACTSLWQDSVKPYIPFNTGGTNEVYDVAIIGGGITGVSTALLLQLAGKRCIILEAAHIGYGTTGGTTAHLNTVPDTPYPTIMSNFGAENAKAVAASLKDALQLISKNIYTYAIECGFKEATAYMLANTDDQVKELHKILEACHNVGVDAQTAELSETTFPYREAMRIPSQARFNPLQYVYGIAKAFENAGGIIQQQCRVTGLEDNSEKTLQTDRGAYKAKAVVYATHIPTGINLLHLRCMPYRSYAMAVTLSDDAYPAGLYYDMEDPYHYYRTQEADGKKYLIAGGKDHKTGHEENTDRCFIELEAQVRKYFNVESVAYKWSSQYYEPVDGIPYIGPLPGHTEGVYVATGFGGNGMVYSSVAAIVLSRMLSGQEVPYADVYNPNRVKPVAGFSNFVSHNADVVNILLKQWFSKHQATLLAEMAPGESKIVKWEDHLIALHKDANGSLHALSPKCTHMGCHVNWNTAEQSWDCPCHGARYSCDGVVLNAPADRMLAKIDLS